jgi:hypothetical protein
MIKKKAKEITLDHLRIPDYYSRLIKWKKKLLKKKNQQI